MGGEMVDDQEFDLLLNEIPLATSLDLHQNHSDLHNVHGDYGYGSCVAQKLNCVYNGNGLYGLCDEDTVSPISRSSSSLFSGGCAFSDTESLDELTPRMPYGSSFCSNGFCRDSKILDCPVRKKASEGFVDELGMLRNLSAMYVSNEQEDGSSFKGCPMDRYGFQFPDENYGDCYKFGKDVPEYTRLQSMEQVSASNFIGGPMDQCGFKFRGRYMSESHGANVARHGAYRNFGRAGPTRFDGQVSTPLSGLHQEYRMSSLLGSHSHPDDSDALFSRSNCCKIPISDGRQKPKEQALNYSQMGTAQSNLMNLMSRLSMATSVFCAQQNEANLSEDRAVLGMPIPNMKIRTPSKNVMPRKEGLEAFTDEDSFIIQGGDLNARHKGSLHEIGVRKCLEIRSQLQNRRAVTRESIHNDMTYLPPRYNSLKEARGYIYSIAKDQNGCRFLQRVFDEGSTRDVQIIFDEVIDHVVELMVDPFGNYLMQKLLDVCTEEQRMQILLVIAKRPRELIRISMNTHGTRVVQKLIETLKTRQQISLVVSSLEPGFHSLVINVNGNHVVQRCLQCLSNADNKFIFLAAAKHCVDIGTHQHGCCVLQRCISHSTGQFRENLVAEISANGLLLAEDSFGNYVVQFILDMKIPSAISNLVSQFEGNFVRLSTQRFSSHVVEKCLVVFNEKNRSRIIHELLSTPHFEQLLRDPHANYVIQTALRLSEGSIHSSLATTVEACRSVVRDSPYAKKLFSQKILKK